MSPHLCFIHNDLHVLCESNGLNQGAFMRAEHLFCAFQCFESRVEIWYQ